MTAFNLQVQQALNTVGYSADLTVATQVALLLTSDANMISTMLLKGPAGAGKTSLAKAVAKILGVPYIYVAGHQGSTPEDFLYDTNIVNILRGAAGDRSAVTEAKDVVELGFLPLICQLSQTAPLVAFVDEIDKTSPAIDSLFLTPLQEGEVVVKGIGTIKANLRNLILFFTTNDERQLMEPLMRRCRRQHLDFPSKQLEMDILTGKVAAGKLAQPVVRPCQPVPALPESIAKVLVDIAGNLRDQRDKLIKPPATQELEMAGKDAVRLHQWGCSADLMEEVASTWLAAYPEDRQLLAAQHKGLGQKLLNAAKAAKPSCAKEAASLPKMDADTRPFGR